MRLSPLHGRVLTTLVCLQQLGQVSAASFNLVKDYSGSTFFDEWDFYGSWDNLTLGDVNWLDRTNATNEKLAFVNGANNAILKVDNTTNVIWQNKRDSIRITTQKEYAIGTIWIADIVHMPFGCSVWPALWTKGPLWPNDGEIDIIEGINLMQNNQMALHTQSGCSHVTPAPANQRGTSAQLDCSIDAGCTVLETAANSYGAGFNSAGGGVYATQFDATGVYIWFWSRANIPKSISSSTSTSALASIDDWGPPAASYPSGATCDIGKFFGAQSLVIDITLCGNWAGDPAIYSTQCSAQGTTGKCYDDNVVGAGDKYNEAYFEIKYVRAYSNSDLSSSPTTSSGASATTTGQTSVNTTKSGTSAGQALSITFGPMSFMLLASAFLVI
ncbi:hypothetical protein BDN70DRAFT_871784 [Pholiota conissans]|uniref:GH16 domain-containing protein n=1 Tax=Pholiota conissans TaxID=109636 RepID=A0A9P5ZBM0_9AGAR|nr:hypothetical protein BDN70DRAFT_871784 [Pholiota conissans]